jgi:hemerythrin superfamily protein
LVVRAVSDHLRLHALVRNVKRQISKGEADQETLDRISRLLTEHVRFEEQELFPLVERLVPEDELRDLAIAGRRDV